MTHRAGGEGHGTPRIVILFASAANPGIVRVSANGGEPTAVTTPTPEERTHRFPFFLPDGRRFLYWSQTEQGGTVMVASLDGGPPARLVESMSKGEYSAGHLLYLNGTTLTAQPFDPDRLQPGFAGHRPRDECTPQPGKRQCGLRRLGDWHADLPNADGRGLPDVPDRPAGSQGHVNRRSRALGANGHFTERSAARRTARPHGGERHLVVRPRPIGVFEVHGGWWEQRARVVA